MVTKGRHGSGDAHDGTAVDEDMRERFGFAALEVFPSGEGDEALHGFGRVNVFEDAVLERECPDVFSGDFGSAAHAWPLVDVFDDDDGEAHDADVGVDGKSKRADGDTGVVGQQSAPSSLTSGMGRRVDVICVANGITIHEDKGTGHGSFGVPHGIFFGGGVPSPDDPPVLMFQSLDDWTDDRVLFALADMSKHGDVFEEPDVLAFGRIVRTQDAFLARPKTTRVRIPARSTKRAYRVRDLNP